jgi:Flp pilus assembly protein TadD
MSMPCNSSWTCRSLFALIVLAAGCQSTQNHQTQARAEAQQTWDHARANVMGSLAHDQYENGNFDKCRATLDEALQYAPNDAKLLILSAKLAIEQGQLELAERELAVARKSDPKNAEADYLSGIVCQRWQQPQTAYEFYTSATQKAPAELAYLMARAETLVALDRRDEAMALLEEKLIYFEHNAAIRDAVGQLMVQKGQYTQACEILREASVLDDADDQIREHLAFACYYAGDCHGAADLLRRLSTEDKYAKRPEIYLTLGECELTVGHPAAARGAFETAAQINPGDTHPWLGVAKAALRMSDYRRAELSINKALAIDASSTDAQLLSGYLRLRQNRLSDALTAFRNANTSGSDPEAICMIGFTYERMGQHAQAARFYAQALKLKPHDQLATRLMASLDAQE